MQETSFPARWSRLFFLSGILSLESPLAEVKKLGLKPYACANAMGNLNVSVSELRDEIETAMGLAAFLQFARAARLNWYM